MVDDRKEDVGQDENKKEVERKEEEQCHGWVNPVELIEVKLTQSYLEVHPQRTQKSIVSTILCAIREIWHANESTY